MTKYLVKDKEELQEIIKTNSKPLNSLDVSNIIDMSFLFSNISNVSYFDIDSMFINCSSLPLLDKVLFLDKSNNDFKRQIYLQMSKEQLEQTYDNLCV